MNLATRGGSFDCSFGGGLHASAAKVRTETSAAASGLNNAWRLSFGR
ncbi:MULTISPECIES: hypothetical protein [Stenotrophomonas]|nr:MULTISPECIES: hypothetical protein [Stenotrophomonas]